MCWGWGFRNDKTIASLPEETQSHSGYEKWKRVYIKIKCWEQLLSVGDRKDVRERRGNLAGAVKYEYEFVWGRNRAKAIPQPYL